MLEYWQMTLEFGNPRTIESALSRIPGRDHPQYSIQCGAYEHCTHVKEHLYKIINYDLAQLSLEDRMIPLVTEDMRLLFQLNSLKRNLDTASTFRWSSIEFDENETWTTLLPVGDDNYRWWQITEIMPGVSVEGYKLISIEMNSRFESSSDDIRLDDRSEFELVVVRNDELDRLISLLTKS